MNNVPTEKIKKNLTEILVYRYIKGEAVKHSHRNADDVAGRWGRAESVNILRSDLATAEMGASMKHGTGEGASCVQATHTCARKHAWRQGGRIEDV
jgi:hypothetical protein